jgi:hypothetical protein
MEKVKSPSFYFLTKHIIRRYFIFPVIAVAIIANGFFISTAFAESTNITGDIEEDTNWTLSGSPYVIDSEIIVLEGAGLFIEEGVVVKFASGASLVVEGKMEVNGSSSLPVYFTSILDDSVGGDTNGDGENTTPSMGDWEYLFVNSVGETSILNNFIQRYSNTGLYVYNSQSVNSINFNSDNGVIFLNSKGSFSNLTSSFMELYEGSFVDIGNSSISNEDENAIIVYDNSFLSLNNSNLEINGNHVVNIYQNSSAEFNDVVISGDLSQGTAISIFNNSFLGLSNGSISNIYNGFEVYDNSSLSIKGLDIECNNNGVSVYDESFLDIYNSNILCFYDGILLYNNTTAEINSVKISGAIDAGIIAFNNTNLNPVIVKKSEITSNAYGFFIFNSLITAHQNYIHGNIISGAFTFTPIDLDFTLNYWGDESGPTHILNPNGIGDVISDNIIFTPFLESNPLGVIENPVIIIPGITGSYLYKNYDDNGEIWPNLDKLIFSKSDEFLNDLALNIDGSVNPEKPIYSNDIIRGVSSLGVHVFDNLISELENNGGYIENESLFVFPYDWRKSTAENANLLNQKINDILSINNYGQIDIIAHSMGGLLAKKYIVDFGKDKIDKLIFLGAPQLGAPNAFKALMYGDDMGYGFNIFNLTNMSFLNSLLVKDISQNMPSVYELLPSEKYIKLNGNYVTNSLTNTPIDLNYEQTEDFMIEKGRNMLMFPFAKNLHNSIDSLDLSDLDTHNFIGCGTPTMGGFTVFKKLLWNSSFFNFYDDFNITYVNGDETVPVDSANKTIGANPYYVKNITHGSLPSAEGVKENILAILKGLPLVNSPNIVSSADYCNISGKVVSTHSPVTLHIYDEGGKHTGPDINGNMEYNIPRVIYDVIGGENYAFLPDGINYKIVTKATDTGGFNLIIEEQEGANITSSYDWTLIPLQTLESNGEIWVGPDYQPSNYSVKMDNDGDGVIDKSYNHSYDGTAEAEKIANLNKKIYGSIQMISKQKQVSSLSSSGVVLLNIDKNDNIKRVSGDVEENTNNSKIQEKIKNIGNCHIFKINLLLPICSLLVLVLILLAKMFIKL